MGTRGFFPMLGSRSIVSHTHSPRLETERKLSQAAGYDILLPPNIYIYIIMVRLGRAGTADLT